MDAAASSLSPEVLDRRTAFALTTSGAVGDLWIAGIVFRARPGTLIEDPEDGIRLHALT